MVVYKIIDGFHTKSESVAICKENNGFRIPNMAELNALPRKELLETRVYWCVDDHNEMSTAYFSKEVNEITRTTLAHAKRRLVLVRELDADITVQDENSKTIPSVELSSNDVPNLYAVEEKSYEVCQYLKLSKGENSAVFSVKRIIKRLEKTKAYASCLAKDDAFDLDNIDEVKRGGGNNFWLSEDCYNRFEVLTTAERVNVVLEINKRNINNVIDMKKEDDSKLFDLASKIYANCISDYVDDIVGSDEEISEVASTFASISIELSKEFLKVFNKKN